MKPDVEKFVCSEIISKGSAVVVFSHPWSVAGMKQLCSVHLNKQKETSTFSCLAVITFSNIVRGDQSRDNKVFLYNVIRSSIPLLFGFLIKVKNNALLL